MSEEKVRRIVCYDDIAPFEQEELDRLNRYVENHIKQMSNCCVALAASQYNHFNLYEKLTSEGKVDSYPEKRELTGAFLRVKRGENWESLDVSDLTKLEIEEAFKYRTEEELIRWITMLVETFRHVAEQFGISRTEASE